MKAAVCLMIGLLAGPDSALFQEAPSASSDAVKTVLKILNQLREHLLDRGNVPDQQIKFELPEAVVNEYLAYSLKVNPRPGVKRAQVRLLPENEIRASLLLDMDAVRQWDPTAVPQELESTLAGLTRLEVKCRFQATGRQLTYRIQSARARQRSIPVRVVDAIAQAIGGRQPEKFDLTKPVPLPFGLRWIWTDGKVLGGST